MTVEAVEDNGNKQVIPIPQDERYKRFHVITGETDAPHDQVNLLASVIGQNSITVFSDSKKRGKEDVTVYSREQINDANIQVELPRKLLGITLPLLKTSATLRWRETQLGDY